MNQYQTGRQFLQRLDYEADLLEELTRLAREAGITMGVVAVIGAVRRAVVAVYDQETQEYREVSLDRPLEILHCTGNISVRDGETVVHAHVTLGDDEGRAFGGHLVKGTPIFAGEAHFTELVGPVLERRRDGVTGLPLWALPAQGQTDEG